MCVCEWHHYVPYALGYTKVYAHKCTLPKTIPKNTHVPTPTPHTHSIPSTHTASMMSDEELLQSGSDEDEVVILGGEGMSEEEIQAAEAAFETQLVCVGGLSLVCVCVGVCVGAYYCVCVCVCVCTCEQCCGASHVCMVVCVWCCLYMPAYKCKTHTHVLPLFYLQHRLRHLHPPKPTPPAPSQHIRTNPQHTPKRKKGVVLGNKSRKGVQCQCMCSPCTPCCHPHNKHMCLHHHQPGQGLLLWRQM